jgi:hypothetical protein
MSENEIRVRLLKDLPQIKAGQICKVFSGDLIDAGNQWYDFKKYPDFFEIIEEDEFFIPETNKTFYYPSLYVPNQKVSPGIWITHPVDKWKLKCGLVCKTEKEAEELHDLLVETARNWQKEKNK